MIAGAASAAVAAGVAGCSTYGGSSPQSPAGGQSTAGGQTPGSGQPAGGGGAALARAADIPVGGGKVLPDQRVVITQPEAGTIKCFSAVCTHQGCTVTEVKDGTINCPCHGSRFKVADGSVVNGPAAQPLAPVAVRVDAGEVRLS
jgi:Rieske Fe-S protein